MLRPEDVAEEADLDTVLPGFEEYAGTLVVGKVLLGGAEIDIRLDPTTGEVRLSYS